VASPAAVGRYLTALRPLVAAAAEERRGFIREVGQFVEGARLGNVQLTTQAAGRLGRSRGDAFRAHRGAIAALSAPASCVDCHNAAVSWLELHVRACEALVEVGRSGELARLVETQRLLGEARVRAQQFNSAYDAAVHELRRVVEAARR
jgi:hypothetical protein